MIASRSLLLALLTSLGGSVVAGQDQSSDGLSVLNNDRGQAPCILEEKLIEPCSLQSRAINSERTNQLEWPIPNTCTCNTVFFNIWSACLISTGNTTLPKFDTWTTKCTSSGSVDEVTVGYPADIVDVDIPSWSFIGVSNNSFDATNAILIAEHHTNSSRPMQIVTPILVGILILIILCTMFFYRRRLLMAIQRRQAGGRSFFPRPFHAKVHKVHETSPGSSWEVDAAMSENVHFADYASDVSSRGHISLSSSRQSPISLRLPGQPLRAPMKPAWRRVRTWKDLLPRFRLAFFSNPWKRKPVAVRSMPRSAGFFLDSASAFSRSSTIKDTMSGKNSIPKGNSRSSRDRPGVGVDGERHVLDSDTESDVGSDNEQDSLIARSERRRGESVILISRTPGVNFQTESGHSTLTHDEVLITPPSPSTHLQNPLLSQKILQELPPVPTKPAPSPPIQPQSHRGSSSQRPSIETTLSSQLGTAHTRERSAPASPFGPQLWPERLRQSPSRQHDTLPVIDILPVIDTKLHSPRHRRSRSRSHSPHPDGPRPTPVTSQTLPTEDIFPLNNPHPHRRGFSADDAADYLLPTSTLAVPHHHYRSKSTESLIQSRSDPILFPGPVRGAGYSVLNRSTDTIHSEAVSWYPQTPPGVVYSDNGSYGS